MSRSIIVCVTFALVAGCIADTCVAKPPSVDIWTAALQGNTAAIKQHIAEGTDLNGKEPVGGSTPLILAAIFGKTAAAKTLIDGGAKLEIKNNEGATALYNACFFCHPEIVKALLKNGANVDTRNKDGATLLEVMESDWSPELAAIYAFVYRALNLEFDRERIRTTRPKLAKLLRNMRSRRRRPIR